MLKMKIIVLKNLMIPIKMINIKERMRLLMVLKFKPIQLCHPVVVSVLLPNQERRELDVKAA